MIFWVLKEGIMMKKISQAIFIEVFESLLILKKEIKNKYELVPGILWSDTNMRLKHYYLDQLQ